MATQSPPSVICFVGFPMIAQTLLRQLANQRQPPQVFVLLEDADSLQAWRTLEARLRPAQKKRLQSLPGHRTQPHWGLGEKRYQQLLQTCTRLVIFPQADALRGAATLDPFGYASEVRHLLRQAHKMTALQSLLLWSSARVNARTEGVIMEPSLSPRCPEAVQDALYWHAEKEAYAQRESLPISILRPSFVIADSKTGEGDHQSDIYQLMKMMLVWPKQLPTRLLLQPNAPLHVIPLDFAASTLLLALQHGQPGKTYHIVDPDPLPFHEVITLMRQSREEDAAGWNLALQELRGTLREGLSWQGLSRLFRAARPSRPLQRFQLLHLYHTRETRTLLQHAETPLSCPPLESYLPHMLRYLTDSRLQQLRRGWTSSQPA